MRYKTGESPQVGDWVEDGKFYNYTKNLRVSGVVVDVTEQSIHVADNNVGILDYGNPATFNYVRKATQEEIELAK